MADRTVLAFDQQEYSRAQLDALAAGMAASLEHRGVAPGDRVALMSSNRPEFVIAVLAIWQVGAVVVLISPAWKRAEVEHALEVGEAAHAVGDNSVLADLMPMLCLDDQIEEGFRPPTPASRMPTLFWSSAPAPPDSRKRSGTPTCRSPPRSSTGATP